MWARKAQNLFSLVSFLRFPSQKRTVLVRKPYVFGSENVRFWDGNRKSMSSSLIIEPCCAGFFNLVTLVMLDLQSSVIETRIYNPHHLLG